MLSKRSFRLHRYSTLIAFIVISLNAVVLGDDLEPLDAAQRMVHDLPLAPGFKVVVASDVLDRANAHIHGPRGLRGRIILDESHGDAGYRQYWYFADELFLYAPTNSPTRVRIDQPRDLFVYPISQTEIRVLVAKPPLRRVTFRLVEDLWIPHQNTSIPSAQKVITADLAQLVATARTMTWLGCIARSFIRKNALSDARLPWFESEIESHADLLSAVAASDDTHDLAQIVALEKEEAESRRLLDRRLARYGDYRKIRRMSAWLVQSERELPDTLRLIMRVNLSGAPREIRADVLRDVQQVFRNSANSDLRRLAALSIIEVGDLPAIVQVTKETADHRHRQ